MARSLTSPQGRATDAITGPVLCIVQQPTAHLGRLRPHLRASGLDVIERAADEEDLTRIDVTRLKGVISLGGDMGCHESASYPFMAPEIDLLARAHGAGVPILGICLGAQLLATALGGTVTPESCREIGWLDVDVVTDDPLLGEARRTRQFQWHSDSFDLPPGAELIATSASCPIEGYRAGRSYGLQFHPEVDADLVRGWATEEGGRAELMRFGIDPADLYAGAAELDAAYDDQARAIAGGFARLVSPPGPE